MKKLSKIFAIIALSALTIGTANAEFKLGLNLGTQIPTGDFADAAKTGFGSEVYGKYMVNENIGVGLGIGFYSFGSKEDAISGNPYSLIPVTGKFTYSFGESNFKPYVGADLGLYVFSIKLEDSAGHTLIDESKSYFGFAPVVGFEYSFSENWALDVNAKYNYVFAEDDALTTFGINAGIIYKF